MSMKPLLVGLCALGVGAAACSSAANPPAANRGGSGGTLGTDGGALTTDAADAVPFVVMPFVAAMPASYVAKVKNVLTGLPPTDDEVKAVTADPTKLKALVAGWTRSLPPTTKMKRFFELAFQQTQVSAVDFSDQTFPKQIGINATTVPLLVRGTRSRASRSR